MGTLLNGTACPRLHACAHCLELGHPLSNCPLIDEFRERMRQAREAAPYHTWREQQSASGAAEPIHTPRDVAGPAADADHPPAAPASAPTGHDDQSEEEDVVGCDLRTDTSLE